MKRFFEWITLLGGLLTDVRLLESAKLREEEHEQNDM